MSLSVREARGRNEELVLHCTVGHKHAHVDGEDSLAVTMVLFAKCSRLTEVSASVNHGDSFQSI